MQNGLPGGERSRDTSESTVVKEGVWVFKLERI